MTDELINQLWDQAVEVSFHEFTRAEPMSLAPEADRLGVIKRKFAELVAAHERRECWELIDSHIQLGPLQGNGCDDTAQRNGMILAANLLAERIK